MTGSGDGGSVQHLDLVHRVVFPTQHDPDVVSLYVDADYWSSFGLYEGPRGPGRARGFVHSDNDRAVIRLSDFAILSAIQSKTAIKVPHGRRLSLGTYFNAFPAAYWRHATTLNGVVLGISTTGEGQIVVYRSNARGVVQRVDSVHVTGDADTRFDLPFTTFGDGGWYWFDLVAEEADFTLLQAGWYAPEGSAPTAGRPGTASVSITTLNRVDYCTQLLIDIGTDADVMQQLDRVYVIDQGTEKIRDGERFGRAEAALAEKLTVIDQRNLGGSGGFSRGMFEVLQAGQSDHVLLLDDDVAIEPESIRRALKFADYLSKPAIVGGHMFDMYDKPALHAYAEDVDRWNFMWGPITPPRHHFGTANLRQTRWLHRRVDAGYNGWWMSLIPTAALKELGLSLPIFIKWDDAEYSLRAAERGIPTITLPGAAVWHVSWVDKDDSQDWQAFYHARNRLVAALLHSPYPRGGDLPRHNLAIDVRHLLGMQYFALAARHEAFRSVLEGPAALHGELGSRLGKVRGLAGNFVDGQPIKERSELPPVHAPKVLSSEITRPRRRPPGGVSLFRWLLRTVWRHAFVQPRPRSRRAPEGHLAFQDAHWWIVPEYDSVLVSNAEGSAALLHRRDRRRFRRMLLRSLFFYLEFRRRWPALAKAYRDALPELTAVDTWAATFELSAEPPRQ